MASDKALFTITTKMEKYDYKQFLYFASFWKTPASILIILVISALGALFGAYYGELFTPLYVILFWVVISVLAVAVVCFRITQKITRREYEGGRDAFGITDHLEFHDKYILITDPIRKTSAKVGYDQIRMVYETKEYFYLYHSENNASMIRKQDVDPSVDLRTFFKKRFEGRFRARKV